MRPSMYFVVIVAATTPDVAHGAPSAADRKDAERLIKKGHDEFNNHQWKDALGDFAAAYALDNELPISAALAAQASVNADKDHPSRASDWLVKWNSSATPLCTNSLAGMEAVGQAIDAIKSAEQDLERSRTISHIEFSSAKCKEHFASTLRKLESLGKTVNANGCRTGDVSSTSCAAAKQIDELRNLVDAACSESASVNPALEK
jgi:hypothetical protein